tara:strand:+ start:578 stop:823 length:246 start_codon:yes stop_codon:yes gene_type:complete
MQKFIISPLVGNKFYINIEDDDTLDLVKEKISKKIDLSKDNFFLSVNNSRISKMKEFNMLINKSINVIPLNNEKKVTSIII